MSGLVETLMARAEAIRLRHNSIPWWHPIQRQNTAREYRYALLAAALAELDGR